MAKLTEYPMATSFDANDILIKDGTNGTKKISIENVIEYLTDTSVTTVHKVVKADDFVNLKTQLSENTDNLFTLSLPIESDGTTGVISILNYPISAGTYKVIFEVNHDYSGSGTIRFSKTNTASSANYIGTIIYNESGYYEEIITLNQPAQSIYVFAGAGGSQSSGYNVILKRFMITSDLNASYITGVTAVDAVARKQIETSITDIKYVNIINENYNPHVRCYRYNGGKAYNPLEVMKNENGKIVKSRTVNGTEKIPFTTSDYVYILDGDNSADAKWCINFYDSNDNLRWDILDTTDGTTGEKNVVSKEYVRSNFGYLFYGFNSDGYIRASSLDGSIVFIVVWDGVQTGYTATGETYGYDDSGNQVKFPDNGKSCFTVPNTSAFILCKPDYTITDIYGSTGAATNKVTNGTRLPSHGFYCGGVQYAQRVKDVLVVKDYDYATDTYSNEVLNIPFDSQILILDTQKYTAQLPTGNGRNKTKPLIRALLDNFVWECKAPLNTYDGENQYVVGKKYHGIPYRSNWQTAHFVGWHISKHTFMNAANDPDSIFYKYANVPNGSYYSLVCSSYATLVTQFPYPQTNYSLSKHPDVLKKNVEGLPLCELVSTGTGHCFVPYRIYNSIEANDTIAQIAESSGGGRTINIFGTILDSNNSLVTKNAYLDRYIYAFGWKQRFYPPYDVEQATTITNGSARPYKGDRSVYTSDEDVKINIKTPGNRLYYQKFDMTVTYGVPSSIKPDGDTQYIAIDSSDDSVVLRGATSNNAHSGVELEDGAIYGIWTSTDDAQATAPDNVEYFEFHDIHADPISYQITDGVLVTDDVFWYANCGAKDYTNAIRGKTSGGIKIGYEAPINMQGETIAHSDYSKYRNTVFVTGVLSFFRKGKLGAYVAKANYSADPDDPDD